MYLNIVSLRSASANRRSGKRASRTAGYPRGPTGASPGRISRAGHRTPAPRQESDHITARHERLINLSTQEAAEEGAVPIGRGGRPRPIVWSGGRPENAAVTGIVEAAIRAHLAAGTELPTPTGRATFVVDEINPRELVLLFGPKKT